MRQAIEDKASHVVSTAVTSAMGTSCTVIGPIVAQVVKEELAAERLNHPEPDVAQATANLVVTTVKNHLEASGALTAAGVPFEQRSRDAIRVAFGRAISIPMIRRAHALAVSVRVLGLANDEKAKGDCVTPFCPTVSKAAGTSSFAVKHYNRVFMAVYKNLLVEMAASGNQPAVFKGKAALPRRSWTGLALSHCQLSETRLMTGARWRASSCTPC
eukprot:TRINITY_DN1347_c0_g1_i4.p1 TRINITY_DN1347_c0_g1~~TRINITY_DN1347_c0_g1_i4.p1  ORF type:complete len:215 (-),score=25.98 TRINITY_DN1347_c0_g1_i4:337-981(-)